MPPKCHLYEPKKDRKSKTGAWSVQKISLNLETIFWLYIGDQILEDQNLNSSRQKRF
jgi:hypothetical protein